MLRFAKDKINTYRGAEGILPEMSPPKFKMREIFWGAKGPHSHILMTGGPSDFFGSEILAQSDFFGSMKYPGIFLGLKKTEGFFWVAEKGARDFFEYAKKSIDFFG